VAAHAAHAVRAADPPRTRRRIGRLSVAETRPSRLAPSIPEWVAILLIVAMPIAYGHQWLSLDGDPGRHIRVGETILRSGLFYHDPFSFTKGGAPFIPYEWLSEVLTALSVRWAGLPGMLVLTGAVLALTYAVVTRTLWRRGVSPIVAVPTLLLVLAVGTLHWHARPHVYTLLSAALLMVLIDRAADTTRTTSPRDVWWAVWPVLPLFACWANLHGGFLYGLFVLGAVVVGDRVEMLYASGPDVGRWKNVLVRHAAMFGVAVIAVMLTPSGPKLYLHTLGYLGDTYLVDNTQEYMSPNFHLARFPLIAIVLVTCTLAILPRRAPVPTLMLVGLNIAFSLVAARNLPLFAIVVLPPVAVELEHALATWVPNWARQLGRPIPHVQPTRLALAWPAVAIALMMLLARQSGGTAEPPTTITETHGLFPTEFNPSAFPVRAVEEARAAGVTGRIFHEFIWGGYILYAWPEQRVFIDGQTDFYGDSVTREFRDIIGLQPGWRAKLAAWRIDLVLVETASPLADAVAHERGWTPVHCDSTAVLFRRDESAGPALGPLSAMSESCASLSLTPLASHATAEAPRAPPDSLRGRPTTTG
jgi:hypothetical protein